MNRSIKSDETESSANHGLYVVGFVENEERYVYSPALPICPGNISTVESSAVSCENAVPNPNTPLNCSENN